MPKMIDVLLSLVVSTHTKQDWASQWVIHRYPKYLDVHTSDVYHGDPKNVLEDTYDIIAQYFIAKICKKMQKNLNF